MVLVDTSVWISHFRKKCDHLIRLLNNGGVATHPFVIGEIACRRLKNREEILSLLRSLHATVAVSDEELLHFIEVRRLMGKGIGLIDVHLLAAAVVARVPLWTYDRKLAAVAGEMEIGYVPLESR